MEKFKNIIASSFGYIALFFWKLLLCIFFIILSAFLFFFWIISWIVGNRPGSLRKIYSLDDLKKKKELI